MRTANIAAIFFFGAGIAAAQTATQTAAQTAPPVQPATAQGVVVAAARHPAAPPPDSVTDHTIAIGGQTIDYQAVAGTLTVGATDAYDALLGPDGQLLPDAVVNPVDPAKPEDAPATARMFYTAYFRKGSDSATRPVMFFYNGGPGSSTMWLRMGSFGPRRVVTTGTQHPAGGPYTIVDNQYCLLDTTDMVFIDAPGTGFSRIEGKDKEKAFYGIDQDAHAFDRFIRRFLAKYDRWNSPKYLFGESYGTPRSAVLSALLNNVDLNGIVLLSTILNFDNSVDDPNWNPGIDLPYELALPSFAATAFYHHKLPVQPAALEPFLREVEAFAMGEYSTALLEGAQLPDTQRRAIAEKLHTYTGLPVDYLLKANLRVSGGEFEKNLQDPSGITTGRLDTRYQGPDIDPLSEEAAYDPVSAAVSSAFTAAMNQYVRTELKYGRDQTYAPTAWSSAGFTWDFHHHPPDGPPATDNLAVNTMPDLAYTMKTNPKMHVLLAGGYFDLATPFFEGMFEMRHLQIPESLQTNIEYKYYQSGHMVYLNEDVLRQFHADVEKFVTDTEAGR